MKVIGILALFFGGMLVLGVIGTALNIITIPWLKLNSQVQMERDIVQRTYNADNALYNYRWFKDRHEALKAAEVQISNAQKAEASFAAAAGPRSEWTFEDKNESARLASITLGLKNNYESMAAEYNSRAQQVDRAVFQDELPLFFSIQPF
jgi:hypothetical protein